MNVPENIENTNIENENKIKLDFIGKIQEIDNSYKRNLSSYKEGIYQFNLKIKVLKSKIIEAKELFRKDSQILTSLENNLAHEEHFFEKLQSKFTQKIESLYELQNEYKEMIEEKKYQNMLLQKEQELTELIFEIEEQEVILFKIELERINRVNILLPKQKQVKLLALELDQLELEKAHFESNTLEHQNILETNINNTEAIDIEIVEKSD